MWNGVTLTKNSLGQLCLMAVFIIVWTYLTSRRVKIVERNRAVVLADGVVFALAIYLMVATPGGAYSATAVATMVVVFGSLFLLYRSDEQIGRVAKLLVWGMSFMWVAMTSMQSFVTSAVSILGRDETLTGRTDIWEWVLADAWMKPIFGTGFGAYFATDNEFTRTFGYYTAHNGLLDVFVETGLVGIIVLVWFLWGFYKETLYHLKGNMKLGIFGVVVLIIILLSNFTESIFLKSSSYIWNIMVFVSIIMSSPDADEGHQCCK